MATVYSGSGDPKRSMELLWGIQERPKRGPKPRLTVEAIARAAVTVADAEGLEGLSMRRVADELDVPVMSLYTYVPGKAELMDVMLDMVCGETARPEHVAGDWRVSLELVARENWALCRRHPWMLQISVVRPVMGPNLIAKYDYELRAVEGTGLSDVEMDSVLTLVLGYVHSAARGVVDAAEAERITGLTDDQWWQTYAPLLEKVFDAERYPVAARVGAAAGAEFQAAYAPEHAFEFGLHRVLDGIEALVRQRSDS